MLDPAALNMVGNVMTPTDLVLGLSSRSVSILGA